MPAVKNQILDYPTAIKASAGNIPLAQKLLALFVSQIPEYHSNISELLSLTDFTGLKKQIHKLNSASQYLGAPALKEIVSELDGQITSLSKISPEILTIKVNLILALLKQIETEGSYQNKAP